MICACTSGFLNAKTLIFRMLEKKFLQIKHFHETDAAAFMSPFLESGDDTVRSVWNY